MDFKVNVYQAVAKIPKGKVVTYGLIAKKIGKPKLSRQVGWPHTELTSSRGLRPRARLATTGTVGQVGGAFVRGKALHARAVGNALHKNTDLSVPCHRVVDRNGRLAPNFAGPQSPPPDSLRDSKRAGRAIATGRRAFDGWREQKRILEVEGVTFKDEMHVNLEESLWQM
ncbi:MAG: MGMT family protein [Candidatus Curtissbacteria bacterium]|nr:MGMT family protein [Candidatus Curtissbacteria bacterium]